MIRCDGLVVWFFVFLFGIGVVFFFILLEVLVFFLVVGVVDWVFSGWLVCFFLLLFNILLNCFDKFFGIIILYFLVNCSRVVSVCCFGLYFCFWFIKEEVDLLCILVVVVDVIGVEVVVGWVIGDVERYDEFVIDWIFFVVCDKVVFDWGGDLDVLKLNCMLVLDIKLSVCNFF